jgi:DNA-binding SARP family transcriptional activator
LLLAYLAFHTLPGSRSPRSFPREQLMELLWPEVERRAGLNHLKATLHWLRQELEPPGVPFGSVLHADRTSVGLDSAAVTTDVAEFAAALEAAARAATSAERAALIARAVELYRGELLPGWCEEWVLQERQWLAERFFQALCQQIAHLEQAGDLSGAVGMAQRSVTLDPLREEAHAELIRLYAAAGQPAAARRQFAEMERLLKEALHETPSAATRTLIAQIERQSVLRRSGVHVFRRSGIAGPSPERPSARTSERPSPDGENRLVTVLFADMSRSVETMRELHPEDAVTLINRLFRVMVDAVLRYEGQVDRFLGDGVLAVFGLLQAHEDDAERAIRAALAIREGAQARTGGDGGDQHRHGLRGSRRLRAASRADGSWPGGEPGLAAARAGRPGTAPGRRSHLAPEPRCFPVCPPLPDPPGFPAAGACPRSDRRAFPAAEGARP